jgi:glycosyltransferase involved in cell wall biosynthesis
MRVLIATVQVPFVRGGAEMHAEGLQAALAAAGHQVEQVKLPFKWYPPERILDHILAMRLYDLTESSGTPIDRVIGLKFPAYLIPHPSKVLWILHQHRAAYDFWGGELCDLSGFPNGREVRDAVRAADREFIPEARAIYANSRNVADRLNRFCGIASEPLYHPPPGAARFRCAPAEDFLYLPSRVNPSKRQLLVVEALGRCEEPVRVCFSGLVDDSQYAREMADRIRVLGLAERIEWLDVLHDEARSDRYARCLGVLFVPVDEDYGYVTLEAMLARKPVITCSDSGGPLEFVRDGETGLVVEPTADSLAGAMDRLWRERARAAQWGEAGREAYDRQDISWDRVVATLTRDV